MGISKGNGGPFGIPEGNVTTDNPDGVSKTMGKEVLNSLYDSYYVGDGMAYGAFRQEDDLGFIGPDHKRSNGAVTEPYKK